MRLAASASVPFLSLSALTVVTALGMTSPVEAIVPEVDITSSPEPIEVREQAYGNLEHHSVWEGTYVCLQGLASVKLTIDVDSFGVAVARYDFGPVPSNPITPKTGAFILIGELQHHKTGGFTGELDAREWIARPDDYIMAPLSIETEDGLHMRGRIHHEACSDFQATRTE